MFRIIPAIDLIGGRGVRLEQGDFSKETVYALNPVEQALKFERMGLRDLHLVDLDGARSKRLEHQDILRSVSEATSLHLDYGRGVRNEEDIEFLLSLGASKVVLGSAAARHSEQFVKSLELIDSKNLVFSCYIRNKKLQLSGWQSSFSGDFWSLLDQFSSAGLEEVQCTAIDRDGMLNGPDFELYEEAIRRFPQLNWIASGGVSSCQDLIFLDIQASEERRETQQQWVEQVAREVAIPFAVGGGISSVDEAYAFLRCGADKICVNSAALARPQLIAELADAFGQQRGVLAIDATLEEGSWRVYSHGGKRRTDRELTAWAKEAESLGAGEILFTSMDHDGTKDGFALEGLKALRAATSIPIIASGGAGEIAHFTEVFKETDVEAALAASVFHFGEIEITELKQALRADEIPMR